MDDQGLVPDGEGMFSLCHCFQTKSGAHQASYPGVMWVKQPGCEADHSLPSPTKIKNEWRYTSFPPICLHGVVTFSSCGT
jgi:hypothetical protein